MAKKYIFIRLNNSGETEEVVSATVEPGQPAKYEPESKKEWLVDILTNTSFYGPGDIEGPIDVNDPKSWERVPVVFRGSRIWVETENA